MFKATSEREVFDACVTLDPAERELLLSRTERQNPELARRVRKLLDAHARADQLTPAGHLLEIAAPPEQIGPYKLLGILGEGGMGTVYEAAQTSPVRRRVALKLVRGGTGSEGVIARFEAERQALAVMDHPHIARVLEAGSTERGQPFFVMELVRGVPLTRFCDEHRLSLRQRLELFILLCQAVQHAHQKGVIHRDLKPSNVLVSLQDGKATPKVIDFGIAKAVGHEFAERAIQTQHGAPLGTPSYMSPEQAEPGGVDVDTRADIYSLGVLLYELLVGVLPFDASSMGLREFFLRLTDRNVEAPVPSSTLGLHSDDVASKRSTDTRSLTREMAGDLDWVVMKAIDKDRNRRYQTANALAVELSRYLASEPVVARPPSAAYRFRKFVRRNRPLIGAASVAAAALILGLVGVTVGLIQSDRARDEAERQAIRATEAEHNSRLRLRGALIEQARALRRGSTPGRRVQSLELLSQAAAIQPGQDLRTEAISSLTLTDLRRAARWQLPPGEGTTMAFSGTFKKHARGVLGGAIQISEGFGPTPVVELPGFGLDAWLLRFSRDEKLLAAKYHAADPADGAELRLWDLETSEPIFKVGALVGGSALDFTPDGTGLLFGVADGRLYSLDLATREQRAIVKLPGVAADLSFRPDGDAFAVSIPDPAVVEIRATADAGLISRLDGTSRPFRTCWSGDGRQLAVAYASGVAEVWDIEAMRRISTLRGHQAEVVDVGFHPRFPLIFSYSWDETSRFWNPITGEQLLVDSRRALGFSRDGRQLSYLEGGAVGTWEVLHGKTFHTLYGHQGKGPRCVDISDDGATLASGGLDGVFLWDFEGEQPLAHLPAVDVSAVFFVGMDKEVITCGADGLTRWPLDSANLGSTQPAPIRLIREPCRHAALDPSGPWLVSLHSGEKVFLYEFGESSPRLLPFTFSGIAHPSLAVARHLVAAGNWRGEQTAVFDVEAGAVARALLPGQSSVSVLFSPGGNQLVTGSTDAYRIWDTVSWDQRAIIGRPPRYSHLPGLMAFNSAGTLLAVVKDHRTVELWDPGSGHSLVSLELSDPQAFTELVFSRDGRHLAVSSSARRILIWSFPEILEELTEYGLDAGLSVRWPGLLRPEPPTVE